MSEVMRLVGQSLAPEVVLREMLHLLSELLGLNRGRIVLADGLDVTGAESATEPRPACERAGAILVDPLCLRPDQERDGARALCRR